MHPGYQIEAVYICRTPVDFRKSITGLSAMVEHNFELDPFGQALFVFVNRHRNRIKILYWHRNGFCLWYKRLEAEKFAWPKGGETDVVSISSEQLLWLLDGYDIWSLKPHKMLKYQCIT